MIPILQKAAKEVGDILMQYFKKGHVAKLIVEESGGASVD